MQTAKNFWIGTAIVCSIASTSYGQNQTRDGALLGGVTGALIGGVVGHQNKETTEGALIGGAVGAIAGGVIGNKRDQVYRQQYYQPQVAYPTYHEHRTYVQVPPQQRVVVSRRPVTISEVINMTRNGVSDTVIVAHMQTNGIAMQPDVNDVILMNQQGVSDYVVNFMQTGGRVTPVYQQPNTVYRTYQQTPPVVVREEYHYAEPVYQSRPSYRPVYVERRGF